jgi:hypothetical protein
MQPPFVFAATSFAALTLKGEPKDPTIILRMSSRRARLEMQCALLCTNRIAGGPESLQTAGLRTLRLG